MGAPGRQGRPHSRPSDLQAAAQEIEETDTAVSPPGLGQSVGRGQGPAGQLLAWTLPHRNEVRHC